MRSLKNLALTAAAAGFCIAASPSSPAQVSVGVAPACPYGYYDYAPYNCAPYGFYGSEWFSGGVFIGAGPWFHGPEHFNGHDASLFEIPAGYVPSPPPPSR